MAALPPFPTFLIIGAERCATRWLRFNLDQHPEICAPPIDTQYFVNPDRMQALGSRWYREQFEPWDGSDIVGEASPSYLLWRNDPAEIGRRIIKLLPEVRIIALVRDPIDRLHSALRHAMRWGRIPLTTDPWEAITTVDPDTADELFGGSMYFTSVHPYADRFGDQFMLLFLEDVVDQPEVVYRAASRHVGVEDTTFVPAHLDRVLYSDRPALPLDDFSDEQRKLLYEWFRADLERLAEVSGRDLMHWDPSGGAQPARAIDLADAFGPPSGPRVPA